MNIKPMISMGYGPDVGWSCAPHQSGRRRVDKKPFKLNGLWLMA
jgi:hypothetical protein